MDSKMKEELLKLSLAMRKAREAERHDAKPHLYPEDLDSLKKYEYHAGPCFQVSRLAFSALKRLFVRVIESLNDRCEKIIRNSWSCSYDYYQFRNGFECASWLEHGRKQLDLFDPCIDLKNEIKSSVRNEVYSDSKRFENQLVLAWFCNDKLLSGCDGGVVVDDLSNEEIYELIGPFLDSLVNEQTRSTGAYVENQITRRREEYECARKAAFEYDDEDFYMETVLLEVQRMVPGNELVEEALDFARRFTAKEVMDDDSSCGFMVVYRQGGESRYVEFSLSPERMAISTGGYVVSDAGGDSYDDEVWSLEAYEHASGYSEVIPEVSELLELGAEIEEL